MNYNKVYKLVKKSIIFNKNVNILIKKLNKTLKKMIILILKLK